MNRFCFVSGKRTSPVLHDDEYSISLHRLPEAAGLEEKRNLQSIKAQYKPKYKRSADEGEKRSKRDADYFDEENAEYPSPVYQSPNIYDYEDWMQDLMGAYPNAEKRFLGKPECHVSFKYDYWFGVFGDVAETTLILELSNIIEKYRKNLMK